MPSAVKQFNVYAFQGYFTTTEYAMQTGIFCIWITYKTHLLNAENPKFADWYETDRHTEYRGFEFRTQNLT